MRVIWSTHCSERVFDYAVRSGQLAAQAILSNVRDHRVPLAAYEEALDRDIVPDFRATARIARVIYAFPRLGFKLLRRYQDVIQSYYGVLQGRTTAEQFLVRCEDTPQGVGQRLTAGSLTFAISVGKYRRSDASAPCAESARDEGLAKGDRRRGLQIRNGW